MLHKSELIEWMRAKTNVYDSVFSKHSISFQLGYENAQRQRDTFVKTRQQIGKEN